MGKFSEAGRRMYSASNCQQWVGWDPLLFPVFRNVSGRTGPAPRILKGGRAASPEEMVKARFSAVRAKDAVFMGKTEARREESRGF